MTRPMTYVALLRGINVGGHAVVSMKDLKSCFEQLGLQDVTTYINSGNIVFRDSRTSVSALAERIESGIKKYCRMDIRVVVKSKDDMARICKELPEHWVTDKTMRTDVMFLWDDVDTPDVIDQIAINPAVDRLLHVKGAVIWNVDRKDSSKSKLPKIIGTRLYKNMTARNANTTRKLLALMSVNDEHALSATARPVVNRRGTSRAPRRRQ
jgi:uncharacterized protein (DUF1697 family)